MINGAWLKQGSFGGKYLAGKYLLLLPIEKENYLLKYIFFSLKWVKYLADSALKDFCNTFKEIAVVFPHVEFWLHVLFVYFHWAFTCGITLKTCCIEWHTLKVSLFSCKKQDSLLEPESLIVCGRSETPSEKHEAQQMLPWRCLCRHPLDWPLSLILLCWMSCLLKAALKINAHSSTFVQHS